MGAVDWIAVREWIVFFVMLLVMACAVAWVIKVFLEHDYARLQKEWELREEPSKHWDGDTWN